MMVYANRSRFSVFNSLGAARWAAAEPPGGWNGLASTYSLTAILNHDANGNIIGVDGSYAGPLNILQNFWESVLANPLDSGTVEVQ